MKKSKLATMRACLFFTFLLFLPFYFFTFLPFYLLKHYRSVTHATGRCNGRQKRCERGYYHLHRNLNKSVRLHTLILFDV